MVYAFYQVAQIRGIVAARPSSAGRKAHHSWMKICFS
jgi:hypothetical protein